MKSEITDVSWTNMQNFKVGVCKNRALSYILMYLFLQLVNDKVQKNLTWTAENMNVNSIRFQYHCAACSLLTRGFRTIHLPSCGETTNVPLTCAP